MLRTKLLYPTQMTYNVSWKLRSIHGYTNWGSSGFSQNQNHHDSPGAYVTCMYCCLSVKTNMRKMPHDVQRSWTHLLCICSCMCGHQKPKDPQIEPDGWQHHCSIVDLRSLVYICGSIPVLSYTLLSTFRHGHDYTSTHICANSSLCNVLIICASWDLCKSGRTISSCN